jgi:hypothetical protein
MEELQKLSPETKEIDERLSETIENTIYNRAWRHFQKLRGCPLFETERDVSFTRLNVRACARLLRPAADLPPGRTTERSGKAN